MILGYQKRKKNIAMLFMASLLFMVGHVFLLNPQSVQAATNSPSNLPIHHDTTEHRAEKHVPCPAELHQFSYVRAQDPSLDVCDFTFNHVLFASFDITLDSFTSSEIILDRHLPPLLPLAQKTHLRI